MPSGASKGTHDLQKSRVWEEEGEIRQDCRGHLRSHQPSKSTHLLSCQHCLLLLCYCFLNPARSWPTFRTSFPQGLHCDFQSRLLTYVTFGGLKDWWIQAIHVIATVTVITEEQLVLRQGCRRNRGEKGEKERRRERENDVN